MICIYHPTMGEQIRRTVLTVFPELDVRVVRTERSLYERAATAEILLANDLPAGVLSRLPELRWLHLTGAGTDHVGQAGGPPELLVSTSGPVPSVAVSEFVWAALLGLAKCLPQLAIQQRQHEWRPPNARRIAGTKLLIVGLGRIGSEIARRAAGFDVQVEAIRKTGRPSELVSAVHPPAALKDVAKTADHIVVALPATPETRHLIDEAVLSRLRPSSVLINVGRASTIDTEALVSALERGHIRAALLDVHDSEPVAANSPLWDVKNLWLTPHSAFRFPEEEGEIASLFLENLRAYRAGRSLKTGISLAPCDTSVVSPTA